jgi:hypothetical protein
VRPPLNGKVVRRLMKARILVDLTLSAAVMLVAVLGSGAPARVHAAEVVALVVGFSVPALAVGRPSDILKRWRLVIPATLAGALAWDIGASATISKVDPFSLPAIYVVVPVACGLLLAIHGFVVRIATKDRHPPVSPSNPRLTVG